MDRWYQPKRTRAHNGVCGPALGLYSQERLRKASLLYLQKTKGKTLRVSSWEFPRGLAVGILSFHCHDPSSLPRQGTEILKGTCCGQKKKKMSFFSSLEKIICNCMVMDLNYTRGNHFVMYANNKYYVTHLKLMYISYTSLEKKKKKRKEVLGYSCCSLVIDENIFSLPLFLVALSPFRTPLRDHCVKPGEASHQNVRFSFPVSFLCLCDRAEAWASQGLARLTVSPAPGLRLPAQVSSPVTPTPIRSAAQVHHNPHSGALQQR